MLLAPFGVPLSVYVPCAAVAMESTLSPATTLVLENSRQDSTPGIIMGIQRKKDFPTTAVLYPAALPPLHREAVTGASAAFLRWFWIPEWTLEAGQKSRQHLIAFPACNIVVEQNMIGLSGPATRASFKDLEGKGWAVGALLRPAAVPALTHDVGALSDKYQTLDAPELAQPVHAAMTSNRPLIERRASAIAAFSNWLLNRICAPSAEGILANRMVETVETDPTILTVSDLAAQLHLSPRTLQRLAAKFVGLPPATLIRRRRIQEVAERLRQDAQLDLSVLANELGYADHAHLTRECKAVLGFTPSSYRDAANGSK